MGVVKYSQLSFVVVITLGKCSMDPFLEFQEALPWQSIEKTKGWSMVSTL